MAIKKDINIIPLYILPLFDYTNGNTKLFFTYHQKLQEYYPQYVLYQDQKRAPSFYGL